LALEPPSQGEAHLYLILAFFSLMKILIVGKGASGKDTLCKEFTDRGVKKCVFNTDRPARKGEVEGVDYFFSDSTGPAVVEGRYNEWRYSLTEENWRGGELAVFTPSYLKQLPTEERKDCFVIYLDVPEEVRRERLLSRSDVDTVSRRIESDESDFKDFKDYDWRIYDSKLSSLQLIPNFEAEMLFSRAVDIIKKFESSGETIKSLAETLDKEWGSQDRPPLPSESVSSYVISRLHLRLNSIITINEDGKYLLVYIDEVSKSVRSVGNLSLSTSAESLFEELSKTIFRKVRETQLGIAESKTVIRSVLNSHSFGSLPKRVQENVRGFHSKFK
jgi:guanylate kinase